jgi:dynein heavy chain
LDHKGWYDRSQKEKPFMKIEDIILITAMGPPGGGRSAISHRMKRHFNMLAYPDLAKESIVMIFNKILKAFVASFSGDIAAIIEQVVDSCHCVYTAVADNLKPTPSKSHYTFNLRDISKIVQGVCAADPKSTNSPLELMKLWIHENQRVFGDRMTIPDKAILLDLLLAETEKLKLKKTDIFTVERLLYGDYMNGIDGENRPYVQINDLVAIITKINEYLEDFNSGSKHPMKLVMFLDACDHVNRICRVLR